jgi:hypothetical protein
MACPPAAASLGLCGAARNRVRGNELPHRARRQLLPEGIGPDSVQLAQDSVHQVDGSIEAGVVFTILE